MAVPKCKECEHLIQQKSQFVMNPKNKSYWCRNVRNIDLGMCRNILSKEIKTSPKWCPLRCKTTQKEVKVDESTH